MYFEESYKKLNAAQKEAVDAIEGPVMVVAGPGTGKTQVISLRIGNILKKTDTTADGVLCLTFTNSGVHAMRKRLQSYIGAEAGRVVIATFHSFGIKIIEEFYHALGFTSAPEMLDDAQLLGLVDDILNSHEWIHLRPRGNGAMYFQDLKSLISLLKRENMSPEVFLSEINKDIEFLKNGPESISSRGESKGKLKKEILTKIESLEKTREVVKFYELYEEIKKERNVMDYDDILSYLLKLVTDSENARDTLRERYLYVLVDEHQDSSGIQNAFLKAVWGDVEKPNVFVVGDDRQLIYGFGGASLSHFEEFKHTFCGAKVITLAENYRSTQIILDAADTLLKSVLTKDSLKSQSKETHPVMLVEADYPRDEVIQAGHFFLEKMSGGTDASDCALLVPKNAHVRTAMHILAGMGIPVASSQSMRLFETKEFKSIFNVFQIMNDPFSNVAIAESMLDEISQIPPLVAHTFLHRVYTRELSLQHLLDEAHSHGLLADADPIYTWGKKIETTITESKGKSLYDIVQHVGYAFLLDNATEHESYIRRVEVVRSLLHLALSLEEKDTHTNLGTFIAFIKRMQEYGQDVPLALLGAEKGVRVMTLHASKGLEYDCVWIAHMNERTLMSSKSIGFSLPEKVKEHIEEKNEAVARRELYVALTRAKRFCVLSYARLSHKGNQERLAMIIDELPKDLFEFTDSAELQKEIVKNGNYISQQQAEKPNVTRDELRELVANNYHKSKVSVTLLNNFYECPWKWYFRSFLQVPEPMAESLIFGSIVHGTIENLVKFENARNSKGIENAIAAEIKKNHLVDEKTIARFTREATAVAERFLENFIPTLWEQTESEKALSYKDERLPNILITGKIDLIEKDGAGDLRVTDFKTGKTRTSKDVEKPARPTGAGGEDDEGRLSSYLRQLAMYSYLVYNASKGNQEVSKSRLYFVEEKDEKKALYETHVSGEHIDLLVKDMKDYDKLMQNGEWTERPCNFKPWGSVATECPYCKLALMYK